VTAINAAKCGLSRLGMPFANWLIATQPAIKQFSSALEGSIVMGNKMFWAFLWVIGIPLPVVVVLYMLFGGGCS
jgi:hypothetical protein